MDVINFKIENTEFLCLDELILHTIDPKDKFICIGNIWITWSKFVWAKTPIIIYVVNSENPITNSYWSHNKLILIHWSATFDKMLRDMNFIELSMATDQKTIVIRGSSNEFFYDINIEEIVLSTLLFES